MLFGGENTKKWIRKRGERERTKEERQREKIEAKDA
jgi:hypothetical protein